MKYMEELLHTIFLPLLVSILASIAAHFIIKKIENNQKKSINISKHYKISVQLIIHLIDDFLKKILSRTLIKVSS